MTTTTPAPAPEQPTERTQSVGDAFRDYITRVRGGEVGALPALGGLVVLVIVFWALSGSKFTNAFNFSNLILQGSAIAVFAMGLVFVLLLGEIDLSAGYTGGVCAGVVGKLMNDHGFNWILALLGGLVCGALIGLCIGLLVARLGIPSFVVTLAGFLAFQGVLLLLTGAGGTIGYRDSHILAKIAGLAVLLGLATAALNQERSINTLITSLKGVPIVVPIIAVLLIFWTFVLGRTAFGRHLYAVGGNTEAARRAGIAVDRIKISAFMICSTMAAVGGILAASRANSVDPNTGGSNVLLYAVGAAVIGGTSLFGGKGRVIDAVLGGAVVAVIDNGMGLLGVTSGTKYVVTGGVLLLAAGVDALSRRRAAASGL
jgi:D-xylose transport system permease protein